MINIPIYFIQNPDSLKVETVLQPAGSGSVMDDEGILQFYKIYHPEKQGHS